jgi:hypothetical protein
VKWKLKERGMRGNETQSADTRCGVRIGFTTLLLALIVLLAACGSVSSKAKATVTLVPPTATPLPKGWNAVTSPPVGSEGNLTDVAALSASDAWAVGNYETPDSLQRTLIEHWNGTSWTQVPSPNPSPRFNILSAVAAISANDAWAVGYGDKQLIEHWDGKTWTITANPTISQGNSTLSGVAAISASDVWAVGSTTTQTSAGGPAHTEPLVEHWDGASWKVVASAPLPAADPNSYAFSQLTAVTAVSSKDIWVVGVSFSKPLIEHWNGTAWKIIPDANPDNFQGIPTGISAASANDVWAVGSGLSNGQRGCGLDNSILVEHWNGSRWSSVPFAKPTNAEFNFSFNSVVAVAANDAWIVGGYETIATKSHAFFAPVIEHWDGARWSIVPSPTRSTNRGFVGVAAVHGGPAWVVGQAELSNGAGPTVIEQWNASQWAAIGSPSPGTLSNELNGITAISPKDVWAVGSSAGGTLSEHWDGVSWRVVPSANAYTSDDVLAGVAGTSSKDVWAVGSGEDLSGGPRTDYPKALIQHWDGSGWSLVPGATVNGLPSSHLNGVAVISPTNAWAVGDGIQHWDGSHWKNVPDAVFNGSDSVTFFGVAAVAANDVWAVGGQPPQGCGDTQPALIEHWDGAHWSKVPNTPFGLLTSVSAVSSADIWAVGTKFGDTPLIMHWNGKQWSVVPFTTRGVSLVSVTARATDDVWAVGSRYDPTTNQVSIQHWDGHAWTAAQAAGPGLNANVLTSVCAVSASEAWAVGNYSQVYGWQQSLIMRYIA